MRETRIHLPKQILLFAALVILSLCVNAKIAFCQQTGNSTQPTTAEQQESDEQRRLRLIQALERAQDEVKAGRKYIKGLEESVASKVKIIEIQANRQTMSDKAIASLKNEVATAQAIIASQKTEIATGVQEINYLKSELDKVNKKLKRSRQLVKYLIIGIGALVLSNVLK